LVFKMSKIPGLLMETIVRSIAMYGVETWGWQKVDWLKKTQARYCKYALGVAMNTPRYIWRREIGVKGVEYTARERAGRYIRDVMAMDKERWPKICLREEMTGIMNGKATKWGKSMREGIEGSKNRGLCEAIWSGQEGDGVQKKIREELEEWWEQECKKEEEKIEKSTYNTIYKEITAGAVGNEYLNSKGVNMEDRESYENPWIRSDNWSEIGRNLRSNTRVAL
ncbi:hypothetical protein PV328_012094, partial [Microctonus aethiopoides]